MQTAIVMVKAKKEPEGKRPGAIKDEHEKWFNFWPDKIRSDQLQVGSTYSIGYTVKPPSGNFGEQHTIVAVSLPDNAAPLTQIAKNGGPAVMPTQTPSTIVPASSPTYTKDEMIFVCGALNHSLGNPQIDPAKITTTIAIATVNMYREVWAATFGQIPY